MKATSEDGQRDQRNVCLNESGGSGMGTGFERGGERLGQKIGHLELRCSRGKADELR